MRAGEDRGEVLSSAGCGEGEDAKFPRGADCREGGGFGVQIEGDDVGGGGKGDGLEGGDSGAVEGCRLGFLVGGRLGVGGGDDGDGLGHAAHHLFHGCC